MIPMKNRTATLVCAFALLWLATASAQAPSLEGTWYGTINPPGAQFEVAVRLQKKGEGWTGTLLLENGVSVPLNDIAIRSNSASFSINPGQEKVTFQGKLTNNGAEFNGEFKQGNSAFPFKLSRTPSAALQGAAMAIDPNELIAMMTSFSGPVSERPLVPPLTHPAIGYGIRPAQDPVTELLREVQEGDIQLKFERDGDGYVRSLLQALHIPEESQVVVFSKNSLQSPLIGPDNPRILYFNDTVSLGFVRGGFIEIAAQDPEQGINFYILPQQPEEKPFFLRRDDCLRCHLSRNSMDVPGMLMRSVYPASDGTPLNPLGSYLLDHRTKFEERWGGWFVTGAGGSIRHLGNAVVADPAKGETMTPVKNTVESDIVALMVFEHQMHMMNLLTRVGWEFRVAAALESETGMRNEIVTRQLRDATNELVDYMLFLDEVPLPAKIEEKSRFAEKFAAQGPKDTKGRSLRQFDLEHRLMKYPCSYMIYSPAFDALPSDAKTAIYSRMREVMGSRMSAADRDAVTEILRETKKGW
jgi:hypothetical protein